MWHASRFSTKIVDPFCGRGTISVVADAMGYDSIGIDILQSQIDLAKTLTLDPRELPNFADPSSLLRVYQTATDDSAFDEMFGPDVTD